MSLDEIDQFNQGHPRTKRQIDRFVMADPPPERVDDHRSHSAHVREVARLETVTVNHERLTEQCCLDKRGNNGRIRVARRLFG